MRHKPCCASLPLQEVEVPGKSSHPLLFKRLALAAAGVWYVLVFVAFWTLTFMGYDHATAGPPYTMAELLLPPAVLAFPSFAAIYFDIRSGLSASLFARIPFFLTLIAIITALDNTVFQVFGISR